MAGWAILRRLRPYTRVVCGVGLVSPPTLPGLEELDPIECSIGLL
jgi:hypothetical protein